MRCNCSSVLCQFQEGDHGISYAEQWEQIATKERARFLEMKAIMESQDYEENKKKFIEQRQEYYEVYSKLFAKMRKFEEKNMDKIMADDTLSDEQKNVKMREVYAEVERQSKLAEQSEEAKRYNSFIQENAMMNATIEFNLRKEKALGQARLEKSPKAVKEIEDALNIDRMIEKVDNTKKQKDGEKEYEQTKEFIGKILEEVTDMKILCYWQEGKAISIEKEKDIRLEELKIETLAYLRYSELLKVTR